MFQTTNQIMYMSSYGHTSPHSNILLMLDLPCFCNCSLCQFFQIPRPWWHATVADEHVQVFLLQFLTRTTGTWTINYKGRIPYLMPDAEFPELVWITDRIFSKFEADSISTRRLVFPFS